MDLSRESQTSANTSEVEESIISSFISVSGRVKNYLSCFYVSQCLHEKQIEFNY